MRPTDIQDKDIPTADPEKVILQYTPLLYKICKRYQSILDRTGAIDEDDLIQAGRIAICKAQQTYDPDAGASFLSYIFDRIRSAMRWTAGIDPNTGAGPELLEYLDEPITDENGNETAKIDLIPDPSILPFDEPLIEAETCSETAEAVRSAVDRLKSDKQRSAVSMVWLEGKSRSEAAQEMNMKETTFRQIERTARNTLRRDWRLKAYAIGLCYRHIGVAAFRSTWTSVTERAALWRIENHIDEPDPDRQEWG